MAKHIYGQTANHDHVSLLSQKEVRFFESDSGNYAAIKAPATLAADYTLTLPVDDGTSNQVLSTNGSGVLSWVSVLSSSLATGSIFVGIGGVATAADTAAQGDVLASSAGLTLKASVAGSGLSLTAGALAVNVDDSTVEINADTLRVKDAGITNAKVATGLDAVKIGNGSVSNTEFQYLDGVTSSIQTQLNAKAYGTAATWANADGASKVITHNLGTKDIIVQIFDTDDDASIEIDSVVRTDTNTLTLTASQAPAVNWRVVIVRV